MPYYQLGRNENVPLSDDEFLRAHWIIYFSYSRKKGDDYIKFLLRKFSAKNIFEKKTVLIEENNVFNQSDFDDDDIEDGNETESVVISKLEPMEISRYVNSLKDIMINFGKWYYDDDFTPTGEMFDVGNTCSTAIDNYFVKKKLINLCGLDNEHSNGNGSLMRIHPLVLYLYTREDLSIEEKIEIIHSVSALTHAHERSKIACGIYAFVLWNILDKKEKFHSIRSGLSKARKFYGGKYEEISHYG